MSNYNYKKGDIVEITFTDDNPFTFVGERFKLSYQDSDRDWWASSEDDDTYGEVCLESGETEYRRIGGDV